MDSKYRFSVITGSYNNRESHDKTFFLQVLICRYSCDYSSVVKKTAIKLNNSTIDGNNLANFL